APRRRALRPRPSPAGTVPGERRGPGARGDRGGRSGWSLSRTGAHARAHARAVDAQVLGPPHVGGVGGRRAAGAQGCRAGPRPADPCRAPARSAPRGGRAGAHPHRRVAREGSERSRAMTQVDEGIAALAEALLVLDEQRAIAATRELIDGGADPQAVLQRGLADTMLEVGRRWNAGELFLPEVVAAAEIFRMCNEIVEPALIAAGGRTLGHRVVMATVKGDLHDLGKNMVGAMMKTAGFEVHDLGKDVPAERIVEAVRELEPSIVGLSSLLTTTVPEQRGVLA